MIDPVASTAASGLAAQAAAQSASPAAITQTEFLQLFVAQLQNQDPLSPLEPNELTAQLAQFSSLEQLTGINSRLDGLAATARQTSGATALGLIGKEVTFAGDQLALADGKAAEVGYTLGAVAEKVTATVRDASGNIVRVVELGGQGAGAHTFGFDGRSDAGTPLPDGTYQLEVAALVKGAKTPTAVDLVTRATVDGVDLTGEAPVLLAGGRRIGLGEVREVHSAGTAP